MVPNLDRLSMILSVIDGKKRREGKNAPVRVLLPPFSVPLMSPLIIGDEDAFLAFSDPSVYRVRAGVHIHGKESVKMLIAYFDEIWLSSEPIEIRSPIRMIPENIVQVRTTLEKAGS